jgi:cellulose synthase/poly-beta-1,6-N-acetylglucosamine synthase-like glycosyltransferase
MKKVLIFLPYTWPTISTKFFKSFLEMTRFPIPDIETEVVVSSTFPIDRSRNEICDLAVSNKHNADYVLMVDGDNILPKDALARLLENCSDEYPVVSGLYFRKTPPYRAVPGIYTSWKDHETQRGAIEKMGFIDKDGNQCLFHRNVTDFDTVQKIDASGCGCLLIRTDVFKKIDLPYFAYFDPYLEGGDFTFDHITEDMLFFAKLHKAGIKTLLVPTVRCGHLAEKVIGCPENE